VDERYSSRGESVRSTSVRSKTQKDQRGWEGWQIRKHILPILSILLPSGSTCSSLSQFLCR
jgi:hypothetical protein